MKLATASHKIESIGISNTRGFGLDQTSDPSKIFDILTNYTDKPRAVVREYCCNALDIHNQIGQTRPFLVVAPSAGEPMLRIRDYGTGLTKDQVLNIYCVYLRSTKDDDNSQVGGFGLGSKAGFSYTDMFTVTSWIDGVQSIYPMFRDERRVPSCGDPIVSASDEPNGVEVCIPIKIEDFARFENALRIVLQHFPADSFETVGIHFDQWHVQHIGNGWTSGDLDNYDRYHSSKPRVKMGPVVYDCDWSQIDPDLHVRNLIVEVPIGAVQLPFTRENISLDDGTIAYLKKRAADIREEACGDLIRQIETVDSLWTAQALFNQHIDRFSNFGVQVSWSGTQLKRDGVTLPKYIQGMRVFERSQFCNKSIRMDVIMTNKAYSAKSILVIDDLSATTRAPKATQRMRHNCDRLGFSDSRFDSTHVFFAPESPTLIEDLGNFPADRTFKLSELEPPPMVRNGPSEDPTVYVHVGEWGKEWKAKKYSEVFARFFINFTATSPDSGETRYMQLSWTGSSHTVGLTKRARDILDLEEEDLVHAKTYVLERAKELMDAPDFQERLQNMVDHNHWSGQKAAANRWLALAEHVDDPELKELNELVLSQYKSPKLAWDDFRTLETLESWGDITLDRPVANSRPAELYIALRTRYPLVTYLLDHDNGYGTPHGEFLEMLVRAFEVRD